MEERLVLQADRQESLEQHLKRIPGLSRRQISRLKFLAGGLKVNGSSVRATHPLQPGDQISLYLHETACRQPVPYAILYEDQLLLVVDKPAGLVVHPSPGHETDSMQTVLETALSHPLYLKGRLDKDTSGVLVFGKADWVPSVTRTDKLYLALCRGNPGSCTIDQPLALQDRKMVPAPEGFSARTHVRPIRSVPEGTMISVRIEHGRMHQIRAHLASIGHPLLQDPLYGEPGSQGRAMLHCVTCRLVHPLTKQTLVISSRLPEDFLQATGVSLPVT